MPKKVLVTGATGFIGFHLCEKLVNKGYEVYGVGSSGENKPKCHKLFLSPEYKIPWEKIPDIDICFHQGAINDTTDSNFARMLHANVDTPANIFYMLYFKKKCKNFVYASSCSIYGKEQAPYSELKTHPKPLNAYAESKFLFEAFAEHFYKTFPVKVVGLRYTNVYGKYEKHKGHRASMISQIITSTKQGKQINLFKHGEQRRDWVYINDVIEANLLASKSKKSGVFNVGSGQSVSFNELVETISEVTKLKVQVNFVDCPYQSFYQEYTGVNLNRARSYGFKPKWHVQKAIKDMIK